jgi:hypothetical protein|tara:strand:+ start:276 stop:599 length:324 start_codon:yes stop_codon:yes gene_type:complete
MNYSEEQTKYMTDLYLSYPTRKTVEILAEEMEKSIKSIIGKLSREGVYRREIYKTKSGETPCTKVEIVSNIAESLGLEVENLLGLDKAPKSTLKTLEKGIESSGRSI